MVHRRRLHGTRQSTPLTGTCLTGTRLKTGIQPCCSGLQVQGTAISPSGATAYSIRSFVRFCKCKECKFVNLSQIGAGFRRKREPRVAWGRQKLVRTPRVKPELFYKLTVFAIQYGGRGTCPPTGCRGGAPASIHAKTSFSRRARRAGGAAAAPAGRGLPKEARAARSLGKAKAGEDAARQARAFYKLTVFAIQYGGFGGRVPRRGAGAEPLRSSNAYKVSSPPASNLL